MLDERVNVKLHKLITRSRFNPYTKLDNVELTPYELRIIEKICWPLTLKEIAEQVNVPLKTFERQKAKTQEKLCVKNSVGIAIYAIKNKLVEIKE
jgi:DNA-binding NarL/FixJ family response regulator